MRGEFCECIFVLPIKRTASRISNELVTVFDRGKISKKKSDVFWGWIFLHASSFSPIGSSRGDPRRVHKIAR